MAHYTLWRIHGEPDPPGHRYRPPGVEPVDWFWAGFQRADSGCLEWQRGKSTDGYGSCSSELGDGSSRTHRVAWVLTNGPIPDGLYVLHHCDNPPCGEVEHLFLGTQADNVRDMVQKGRVASMPGTMNRSAKLKGPQVLGILLRLQCGESEPSIAARYGVGRTSINNIKLGVTWRDYQL